MSSCPITDRRSLRIFWGFTADYELLPDLDTFVEMIGGSFAELTGVANVELAGSVGLLSNAQKESSLKSPTWSEGQSQPPATAAGRARMRRLEPIRTPSPSAVPGATNRESMRFSSTLATSDHLFS